MKKALVLKKYSTEEITELREIMKMTPYSAEKRARLNEFRTKTGRSAGAVDNKLNKMISGRDKGDGIASPKTASKVVAVKTTRKYTKKTPLVVTLKATTDAKSEIRIPWNNVRVEGQELVFSFQNPLAL